MPVTCPLNRRWEGKKRGKGGYYSNVCFNAQGSPETQRQQQLGCYSRGTHLVTCPDTTRAPPPTTPSRRPTPAKPGTPSPHVGAGSACHSQPPRPTLRSQPQVIGPSQPALLGPAGGCPGRRGDAGGNLGLPRPEPPAPRPPAPSARAAPRGAEAAYPHGRAGPGWSSAPGPRSQAAAAPPPRAGGKEVGRRGGAAAGPEGDSGQAATRTGEGGPGGRAPGGELLREVASAPSPQTQLAGPAIWPATFRASAQKTPPGGWLLPFVEGDGLGFDPDRAPAPGYP